MTSADNQSFQTNSSFGSLAGMDLPQARDYVITIIAAAQRTDLELKSSRAEIEKWTKRCELAREGGRTDLEQQARTRLAEWQEKEVTLQTELWSLQQEIPQLKQELAKMAAFTPSIDASELLDQLETIIGKEHIEDKAISDQIDEHQLDDELVALKEKLKKKTDKDSSP